MAKNESVATSPAPSLVQQGLREVLWGDMPTTGLPKNLKKDVEGVRGLEGKFVVKGSDVEVWRNGGGVASEEEWKEGCAAVEIITELPKVGGEVEVRKDNPTQSWVVTWQSRGGTIEAVSYRLGREVWDGEVMEVRVEQGGLVVYGPDGKESEEVRGDSKGGILLTLGVEYGGGVKGSVTYITRRI